MQSQSQIGQDIFVLRQLTGKTNGTFVDIGAGHPQVINNTFVLETQYAWSGISVDLGQHGAYGCEHLDNEQYASLWRDLRQTPLLIANACTTDYSKLFADYDLPPIIDYLDIDIEPPQASFEVLRRIPFNAYKFRVITFEHDDYRQTNTRVPAREYLTNLGYTYMESDKLDQEDWFVRNDC